MPLQKVAEHAGGAPRRLHRAAHGQRRMPKPHRHISVHGKHHLLLSPEDAPAQQHPNLALPGWGPSPAPQHPALGRCCQPPGENFPFTLLQEKLPKISPSPSVSGTRGVLEAVEKRMSLLNFHGNTRERLHPWRNLPKSHPEALGRESPCQGRG